MRLWTALFFLWCFGFDFRELETLKLSVVFSVFLILILNMNLQILRSCIFCTFIKEMSSSNVKAWQTFFCNFISNYNVGLRSNFYILPKFELLILFTYIFSLFINRWFRVWLIYNEHLEAFGFRIGNQRDSIPIFETTEFLLLTWDIIKLFWFDRI